MSDSTKITRFILKDTVHVAIYNSIHGFFNLDDILSLSGILLLVVAKCIILNQQLSIGIDIRNFLSHSGRMYCKEMM